MAQFEVVSKEDQPQGAPFAQPLHQQPRSATARLLPFTPTPRPPRPAGVRLSTHPYQPSRQSSKRQQNRPSQGAAAASSSLQDYQQLALLPVPEPEPALQPPQLPVAQSLPAAASLTFLSSGSSLPSQASLPVLAGSLPSAQASQAEGGPALQPRPGQHQPASPSKPLDAFAEQLQADLGICLSSATPFQPPAQQLQQQQLAPQPNLAPQQPLPAPTYPAVAWVASPRPSQNKTYQPPAYAPYPTLSPAPLQQQPPPQEAAAFQAHRGAKMGDARESGQARTGLEGGPAALSRHVRQQTATGLQRGQHRDALNGPQKGE
jgi:hypothetical protein